MRFLAILLLIGSALGATIAPPQRGVASTVRSSSVRRLCALRGGAQEHTYAMIKPDVASDETKVTAIKAQIEESGLSIEREERCRLSRKQCEAFYAEHAGRSFFGDLVKFMSSGPVVKLELSGSNAIKRWRELIGPTNSEAAREKAPGSIRALFGTDNQRNAAHGSVRTQSPLERCPLLLRMLIEPTRVRLSGWQDSPESAAREIAMMFK